MCDRGKAERPVYPVRENLVHSVTDRLQGVFGIVEAVRFGSVNVKKLENYGAEMVGVITVHKEGIQHGERAAVVGLRSQYAEHRIREREGKDARNAINVVVDRRTLDGRGDPTFQKLSYLFVA
jgi:hypothetical protein